MTIEQILKKAVEILEHKSDSSLLDSEVLLFYVLDKNKAYLYANGDSSVSQEAADKFLGLVSKRAKGEPVSYLIGTKEFYSLDFCVNNYVLIPRPETEQLVSSCLDEIAKKVRITGFCKEICIADVGTGSGNIAIAVISEIIKMKLNKNCFFTFYLTDISGKALEVAEKNFKRLIKPSKNIKVIFFRTDLLKGLPGKFDIIISNPPYVPAEQLDFLNHTVRDFEPRIALDGGSRGVKIIKNLIKQSAQSLGRSGVLMFEIYERQPSSIKFFLDENFSDWTVSFRKDCFGLMRFTVIKRKYNKVSGKCSVGLEQDI